MSDAIITLKDVGVNFDKSGAYVDFVGGEAKGTMTWNGLNFPVSIRRQFVKGAAPWKITVESGAVPITRKSAAKVEPGQHALLTQMLMARK